MNNEAITIQDCIEMFEYKGCTTVLNDGKVIGFEKENSK